MHPLHKLLTIILLTLPGVLSGSEIPFKPASGVEEVRQRIARLPDDDVWVTVTGEHMAWLHRNVHRVFPTVNVYRAGPVRELVSAPMPEIADYPVTTPAGILGFKAFLDSGQSTTMGMLILHRGKVVFEHYPRQQPYEKPIYWSVAKVLVSTLVGILEDRGEVDVSKPIDQYLPELSASSFAGITVRNILDMATGMDCPEDYSNRDSCYYVYSKTVGEGHYDKNAPDNPYTYIAGLKVDKFGEQGTSFSYSGVNTFVLGWLVEKLTGMPFQDAFTKEVWRKIGAASDASFLAPRFGVPITHGGFMSTLRDLARFGLLYTPSWRVVSQERIVSDRLVKLIRDGGNPALLENARGGAGKPDDVKHSVYQWDEVYTNNDFFKGGWGGQGLLVNPDRDLVAVYTGYFKDDYSEVNPLPLLRQVLEGVFGDQSASK